jgi:glycosyltransferase involved in cell wall biosynthesis
MACLCLLSHGQPAANPRLVRDANALAKAGHDVRVVTAQFISDLEEHDDKVVHGAAWRYEPAILREGNGGSYKWDIVRLRRRISAELADWLPLKSLVALGFAYGNPEVARLAAQEHADLYVAYQHNSLPAAVWAASKNHSRFALDAQDLLVDCSAEPVRLAASLEKRYLPDCVYVSTMSHAAAKRLQETNNLARTPIVLHNTPSLLDRAGITPPKQRTPSDPISLYWFGQTIGPHSCAQQVVAAMPLLSKPVKLVMRGRPDQAFVTQLQRQAEDIGVSQQLQIMPRAEPAEMVRLAAEHDVMLGTQPGTELFNQMAIGNKVFTGMMAGLALALSDTIAHRQLATEVEGCGFLFRDGDVQSLASKLNGLLTGREKLDRMKENSWNRAETKFNWEEESKTLLWTVDEVLAGSHVGINS